MTNFLNGLKQNTNYILTENGAVAHASTLDALYDMFAFGGAMRNRSERDVSELFIKAYNQNPKYALKCLFYLRDVRGGQGERRFFKVCLKTLVHIDEEAADRVMHLIPEYGRWDDLFAFIGTSLEDKMFSLIRSQLAIDVESKTPSLLAKWLKSENTSSAESRRIANKTRKFLGMSHKQYRKVLTILRERIRVLEKLMSENRWEEIEFDKIPSQAGLKYKNAFARRDIIKQKYETFAKSTETKVNAKTLAPYEVVRDTIKLTARYWNGGARFNGTDTDRAILNKYWDNLSDYIKGKPFNGIAVVDTSGSMTSSRNSVAPIDVAISLGLYCAEKNSGPFKNHFITFSRSPQLIEVVGKDFVDKATSIYSKNIIEDTNIEGVFNLLLKTAIENNCAQNEIPQNIIVISDMEFNHCALDANGRSFANRQRTLFDNIAEKWECFGYKLPRLYFWNVDARQNNIPIIDEEYVSYVSGFSPTIFEQIMEGKTAKQLMFDVLNKERYKAIY